MKIDTFKITDVKTNDNPGDLKGLFQVSDPEDLSNHHFPDYLLIGPQRTGTTWLSECLRLHPKIFMSSPKELYFFSHLKLPHHPMYTTNDLNWYVRHFTDGRREWKRKNKLMRKLYGRDYDPQMRGEATASYAAMDDETIRLVHALNPGIKIILLIRNPVDRAWSHAKKDLARDRGRPWQEVGENEYKTFFANEYQVRCGRFSEIIDRWRGVVKDANLLIQPFDAINENPVQLLETVFDFLGVETPADYFRSEVIGQKINSTEGGQIPPQYREFLEKLFADEIDILAQRYRINR